MKILRILRSVLERGSTHHTRPKSSSFSKRNFFSKNVRNQNASWKVFDDIGDRIYFSVTFSNQDISIKSIKIVKIKDRHGNKVIFLANHEVSIVKHGFIRFSRFFIFVIFLFISFIFTFATIFGKSCTNSTVLWITCTYYNCSS